MIEGVLERLDIGVATPATYGLVLRARGALGDAAADGAEQSMALDPLVGRGLSIEFLGRRSCRHCGADTQRRYGDGYCYPCFTTLARCDLCVVSPARCHYAAGTCREPDWGEAFCMQPHRVYLANSSGAKVGITRRGGEVGRWLDQGACQGMAVADADTRHLAGVAEAALARRVSDRTDWRALLRREAAPLDLRALRDQLRSVITLPAGVRWIDAAEACALTYPVVGYPRALRRFRLERDGAVTGRLLGLKGQYLLFDHGVLSAADHRGCHVRVQERPADVAALPAMVAAEAAQMELFT